VPATLNNQQTNKMKTTNHKTEGVAPVGSSAVLGRWIDIKTGRWMTLKKDMAGKYLFIPDESSAGHKLSLQNAFNFRFFEKLNFLVRRISLKNILLAITPKAFRSHDDSAAIRHKDSECFHNGGNRPNDPKLSHGAKNRKRENGCKPQPTAHSPLAPARC
jgi:hypothetical protein